MFEKVPFQILQARKPKPFSYVEILSEKALKKKNIKTTPTETQELLRIKLVNTELLTRF